MDSGTENLNERDGRNVGCTAGLDAKARKRRVRSAVAYLQKYIAGYDRQMHYQDYSDETIINDVLYGLGLALHQERAEFAGGYDWFKREVLLPHLQASNGDLSGGEAVRLKS